MTANLPVSHDACKQASQVNRARIGVGQLIFRKELRQKAILFRSKIRIRVRSISIPLNTKFLFGARSLGIDGRLDEVEQAIAKNGPRDEDDLVVEIGDGYDATAFFIVLLEHVPQNSNVLLLCGVDSVRRASK